VKRLAILLILVAAGISAKGQAATILVFGDSISAGFGINPERGWAALLQSKLKTKGTVSRSSNASVSGETTEGGLARLPRALILHHPGIVILELGGNDGLRALPVDQMRAKPGANGRTVHGGRRARAVVGHADSAQLRAAVLAAI